MGRLKRSFPCPVVVDMASLGTEAEDAEVQTLLLNLNYLWLPVLKLFHNTSQSAESNETDTKAQLLKNINN